MASLSAARSMTPKPTQPAEPIDAADVAAALADAGLAKSYDEAREDVEAARADVAAEAVGDGVIG